MVDTMHVSNQNNIVHFDFHKTFDSVPHQRLLLKLCAYGIQGDLLQWLSDFLIDRKQKDCDW